MEQTAPIFHVRKNNFILKTFFERKINITWKKEQTLKFFNEKCIFSKIQNSKRNRVSAFFPIRFQAVVFFFNFL